MIQDHKVSHRQACQEAGVPRSSYYYQHKPKDDAEMIELLHELVDRHPSIGFGSVTIVSEEKALTVITKNYIGYIQI